MVQNTSEGDRGPRRMRRSKGTGDGLRLSGRINEPNGVTDGVVRGTETGLTLQSVLRQPILF